MKKNYIVPELLIVKVSAHSMLAQSNSINGNSVNLNPNTMIEGNGSDAVKLQGNYVQWDGWGSED